MSDQQQRGEDPRLTIRTTAAARDAAEAHLESQGGVEGVMRGLFAGDGTGKFDLRGLFTGSRNPEVVERHKRERLVRRAVEAEPSRVNRTALVAYRCKSHGCLLGALVQVQGRRYQLWRQNTEIGSVDGADLEERWDAAADGVSIGIPGVDTAALSDVAGDDLMAPDSDGNIPDWHPESLSEWLRVAEFIDGTQGLVLTCRELQPDSIGWWGYDDNMNCRHVEHSLRDGEAEADANRLQRKRNRVVYVDSSGPVKRRK